jgi:hypothetical protein
MRILASTRAKILDLHKVTPAVLAKVDKECERVFTLGAKSRMGGTDKGAALDVLGSHRVIFRNKTLALSDLLAAYRAS